VAEATGGKTFQMPPSIRAGMTADEKWAANAKFLDRGIAEDANFILATSMDDMRNISICAREINYLLDNGYTFNSAGDALMPGR